MASAMPVAIERSLAMPVISARLPCRKPMGSSSDDVVTAARSSKGSSLAADGGRMLRCGSVGSGRSGLDGDAVGQDVERIDQQGLPRTKHASHAQAVALKQLADTQAIALCDGRCGIAAEDRKSVV